MVEETIKTIKETEKEAETLINEANEKCAVILQEALTNAVKIKESALLRVSVEAQNTIEAEKENGEVSVQKALTDVEREIAVLKENVKKKEAEVIAAIIADLV